MGVVLSVRILRLCQYVQQTTSICLHEQPGMAVIKDISLLLSLFLFF